MPDVSRCYEQQCTINSPEKAKGVAFLVFRSFLFAALLKRKMGRDRGRASTYYCLCTSTPAGGILND